MTRPLAVTEDPALLEELLRVGALAGVELEVAPSAAGARRSWMSAPLVLVGGPCRGLPRRPGVVQVGTDLDDATVWQRGVEVGAEHVVLLPDGEDWLVSRLAGAVEGRGLAGMVVGVIGGRGGAGASVLATALAVTAQRDGRRACLVDADPLGGGLDLLLGLENEPGVRWPALVGTRGRVPAAALVGALPVAEGLPVLSWDRSDVTAVPVEAVEVVLSAARRAHDLVVVDLPRSADPAALAAVAACDTVLLVVPAEVRATAAASRVLTAALFGCRDPRVVVRLPGPVALRGIEVAAALGLPLAGTYELEDALVRSIERGEAPARRGRGPLAALCSGLVAELLAVPEAWAA